MFLAQTYYLSIGEEELVATISIGLGFASLIWWLGDFGGSYIVQRLITLENLNVLRNFIFLRFVVAAVISLLMYNTFVFFDFGGEVYSDITRYSSFLIVLGALNLTGYLDSKQINNYFGPFATLGWVFASVYYVAVAAGYFEVDALYFSLCFYAGFGLYVFAQWIFICFYHDLEINLITYDSKVWSYFNEAAIYTSGFFVSQIYGRSIPLIIGAQFGMSLGGLYVYAKTIVNISSQVITFIRRLEFKRVIAAGFYGSLEPAMFLKSQRLSMLGMIITLLGSLFFLFVLDKWNVINYSNDEIIFILSCLLLVVPWFFASAITQVYVAYGKQWPYLFSLLLSSTVSVVFIFVLNKVVGVYVIVLAEVLMFIVQMSILYFFWRRYREC